MARVYRNKNTKTIWIFCEGETEERYFKNLRYVERKKNLNIKTKITQNKRADLIIDEVISFKSNPNFEKGDILACLFDRDNNTEVQLESARLNAQNKDIKIFFSNPCFEVWLLSHYETPSSCEQSEICSNFKQRYFDSKTEDDLYYRTKDRLPHAIKRCEDRIKHLEKNNIKLTSIRSNPLSQVHELIDFINSLG